MAKEPKPAETLKERNRYLAWADEQDWMAENCEKNGSFPNTAARHRRNAARWRELAAAYKPVIEGEN